jgi:hypothetical protein
MPSPLQLAQHHDTKQIADMQAWRRTVKADITGYAFRSGQLVQCGFVRRLVDVAPGFELVQEFGFCRAHAEVPALDISEPVSGLGGNCTLSWRRMG